MSGDLLRVSVRRKAFAPDAPPVLLDVTLTLRPGEVVALLGPSGCGKTTLLRIAAGLEHDFEGETVWRDGVTPRIGTVFQQPLLLPWRTVRQNLRLVLPRDGLMEHAETLMDDMGLSAALDAFPAKLSLGMARRAAIVRALAIEPDVLLLDEPFVSLDPGMAIRARDVVLTAWRTRPTAILLVTHDAADAAAIADRVLLLSRNPGRIAAELVIPVSDRRTGGEVVQARIARAQAAAGS